MPWDAKTAPLNATCGRCRYRLLPAWAEWHTDCQLLRALAAAGVVDPLQRVSGWHTLDGQRGDCSQRAIFDYPDFGCPHWEPAPRKPGQEAITYCIAYYRKRDYLGDCLRSLKAQTSSRWCAIIVVDEPADAAVGAVFDCIRQVFGEQPPNLYVTWHTQNVGYIPALKTAMAYATTDLVAILDPDDLLYPEATEVVTRYYDEHPDCECACTQYSVHHHDLSPFTSRHIRGHGLEPGQTVLEHGGFSHLKTWRMQAYARTEGLDEAILYSEDSDLAYKLEEVTRPHFIEHVCYQYRRGVPEAQSAGRRLQIGKRNHARARANARARRARNGFVPFT